MDAIFRELNKQCSNTGDNRTDHPHANLKQGRAHFAQFYPENLCLAILKGLRKELVVNKRMHVGSIGTTCEDHTEKQFQDSLSRLGPAGQYFDDLTGKPLRPDLIRSARLDEKIGVNKHNVFTKVPIQQCIDRTGKQPIETRWVDKQRGRFVP